MGSTVFLNLIIGLVFKAAPAHARTRRLLVVACTGRARTAKPRMRRHALEPPSGCTFGSVVHVTHRQRCEAWAVPQDACEWFGADPSPSAEVIGTRIQNHFGAIVQIAIGGMFGLAQVRSVPECGPRLQSGFAFALRAGCRMAVRRSRSAVRPAAPRGDQESSAVVAVFPAGVAELPSRAADLPARVRHGMDAHLRASGADDDPWNTRYGCVAADALLADPYNA